MSVNRLRGASPNHTSYYMGFCVKKPIKSSNVCKILVNSGLLFCTIKLFLHSFLQLSLTLNHTSQSSNGLFASIVLYWFIFHNNSFLYSKFEAKILFLSVRSK